MKAAVFSMQANWSGREVREAIRKGLDRRGYPTSLRSLEDPGLDDWDVAAVWGFRPPIPEYVSKWVSAGRRVFVCELGHLRRAKARFHPDGRFERLHDQDAYYQFGIGKLNWLPPPLSCLSDRFDALAIDRATCPQQTGDMVLIAGQTVGDASHNVGFRDMVAWTGKTVEAVRSSTSRKLAFRPHPKQALSIKDGPLVRPIGVDEYRNPVNQLSNDLKDSWAMVTICSTSGQEALLSGIPVFCEPWAIYSEVANMDLRKLDSPEWKDTSDYFNRLAYAQWTILEISDGIPFEFLSGFPN